jgi:hypothetical protein
MVDLTKVLGRTIICTAMEYMLGEMEESMKGIMSKIRNTVMGSIYGLMEENMKVTGLMENNMEKESIFYQMEM